MKFCLATAFKECVAVTVDDMLLQAGLLAAASKNTMAILFSAAQFTPHTSRYYHHHRGLREAFARSETLDNNEQSSFICGASVIVLGGSRSSPCRDTEGVVF